MPMLPVESCTPIIFGNSHRKTYSVSFSTAPTTARDVVSVVAGAGKVLRVRQVVLTSRGNQTTAGLVALQLGSISAHGTGGAAATIRDYGTVDGDGAAVSTARVNDTTPGANFVPFVEMGIWVPNAGNASSPDEFSFQHAEHKSPTVAASHATIKGFSLKHPGSAGAANFAGFIEFTEEDEA